MKTLTKVFIALIVSLIVISFVALVFAHIFTISVSEDYCKALAQQETIFIAVLTLALAIVLLIPYMISKEQIKQNIEREMENYWEKNFQKKMKQFIGKSEINYAHTSRMMAYLLKQNKHYYWAMAWAGDSVVAYINRFKEQPTDFSINKEYFTFSLNIMRISFDKRDEGTFLKDNTDLKLDSNSKKKSFLKKLYSKQDEEPLELNDNLIDDINDRIYKGEPITLREKEEIRAVKELKRVILRYIKWQCMIYIEIKEHNKLSDDVINLIEEHLGPTFENNFKDMVNKVSESFYRDDENIYTGQFVNDIVKKVEFEEEKRKVRKYLEKILKSN